LLKVIVAAAAALLVVPSAFAGAPVASLTPSATHALWVAEVARAKAHPRTLADATCRPARAIFYAQTDWLRLATKLAAQQSPCAQYYVSVPPLAADKSQARPNQAAQIRALGGSFHALDEISWNGWSAWVAAGNGTWYDAGVTARQRMAAAGFDAAAGDTWALNELSSAVRTGAGAARQNALELMRGLSADGVKGVVFTAGVAQTLPDTGTYKLNLQGWLQDTGFWSAASQYASDWAQEDYGDVRAYAVAGTTPDQRRDAEAQYLAHEVALATAGGAATATAAAYLQSSYVEFGNAAWAWNSAYGFTNVPVATMQDFVSGQIYAARSLNAPTGVDRLGFAWAPNNPNALATADFNAQTGSVLDRVAAAIRDSGSAPSAACAPAWCATAVDGAAFTGAWAGFSSWSVPGLVLTSPPATVQAGAPTTLTAQIQAAGVVQNATADQQVTFTSTSPTGTFAPSATVTIPAGSSTVSVAYTDTKAGTPTISAALPGQPAAAQTETVTAAPLATLTVTPKSAAVATGRSASFALAGADAYGNAVAPAATWSLSTTAYGRLTSVSPTRATFTASTRAGRATLTATANGVKATAAITVSRPGARVAGVRTASVAGHLVVTTSVLRGTTPAAGIALTLRVRKGSSTVTVVAGRTDKHGRFTWRSRKRLPKARYVAKATLRAASTASRTQQSAT
jgi:hypothetical protein